MTRPNNVEELDISSSQIQHSSPGKQLVHLESLSLATIDAYLILQLKNNL
jgi:hypothetical protein